jgi:hypothetical protein
MPNAVDANLVALVFSESTCLTQGSYIDEIEDLVSLGTRTTQSTRDFKLPIGAIYALIFE